MIEGVIREDDFAATPALLGCPRPENPLTTANRVLNHFLDVQRGGRGLTVAGEVGIPAPDWALGLQGRGPGPSENQYSVLDARVYQYQSLTASSREMRDKSTALFFRTLGHVLHLVEDMAQPQHTRNDPHAGCADLLTPIVGGHSWYEQYTEDRTLRRGSQRGGEPPPEIVLTGYEPVSVRPYRDFFTDAARRGMADFSSRNFLTAGTNLGSAPDPCGGLVDPPCVEASYRKALTTFSSPTLKGSITGTVTLYRRDVVDALTGQVIRDVPVSSWSVWDAYLQTRGLLPRFSLNRLNYVAMADILLPRAVGYAAGLLDRFFRGQIDARISDTPVLSLRVTNRTAGETMSGELALHYESSDGTRKRLASWSGVTLTPDQTTEPLTMPALPLDHAEPGRYLVVFRGQLGDEVEAVSARWIGAGVYRVQLWYDTFYPSDDGIVQFYPTASPGDTSLLVDGYVSHTRWAFYEGGGGESRAGQVFYVYRPPEVGPGDVATVRFMGQCQGAGGVSPVPAELVELEPPRDLEELEAYIWSTGPPIRRTLHPFTVMASSWASALTATVRLDGARFLGIRVLAQPEASPPPPPPPFPPLTTSYAECRATGLVQGAPQ